MLTPLLPSQPGEQRLQMHLLREKLLSGEQKSAPPAFKALRALSVHIYSASIKTHGWKAIFQTINIKMGSETLQQCGNYPGRDGQQKWIYRELR